MARCARHIKNADEGAVASAPDESRRRRGGVPDASATTRRVAFLLWGGASADPASLHDDDEGASWPSVVLQTSLFDGVDAFRCVSRDRRRPSLSAFGGHCLAKTALKKRSGAAVSRVHRRQSHHSSFPTLLQRAPTARRASSKNKLRAP